MSNTAPKVDTGETTSMNMKSEKTYTIRINIIYSIPKKLKT